MNDKKQLSTLELINRGYVWVNIPAILIIVIVWYCLVAYIELNGNISIIISVVIGWFYWEFAIKKWIGWALNNNVDPNRLLKIGQSSLLLWSRRIIDEVVSKRK